MTEANDASGRGLFAIPAGLALVLIALGAMVSGRVLISYRSPARQRGQRNPFGQRDAARYSRHASSVENRC
jgi:hypothetical protein